MGCLQYRDALSAELDGEPSGLPAGALADHLRGCAACTDWYDRAARVTRLTRLAPAAPMPDLAPAVLAALPAPPDRATPPTGPGWRALPARPGRDALVGTARAALVAVAFIQALLAWSGALTGQDAMATGHLAREVAAWNLALAVAFLAAATRPRSADALVAPVGVFVAVLAVAAAGDAAAGDLTAGRLAGHLLVALGLALLVVVGRTAPPLLDRPAEGGTRPGGGHAGSEPVPDPAAADRALHPVLQAGSAA